MSKTIYRYGIVAWVWRMLIALFLFGGAICLVFGVRHGEPWLLLLALVLLAPALFFGGALAVQVDRLDDGQLLVSTLLFWRRRVRPEQLRPGRLRESYENESGPIYAPRLWVRLRGRLPIYFDLLATIPDRRAFAAVFRVPIGKLPN